MASSAKGFSFFLPAPPQLYFGAQEMPADSSAGPDGRAPCELKALPLRFWELAAQLIFLNGALAAVLFFIPSFSADSAHQYHSG